jgi:isoleucyl-tRNA synthetase
MSAGHIDEQIVEQMERLRDVINQGLSLRAKHGIKVRQPLASIRVPKDALSGHLQASEVIFDELNVKAVHANINDEVELDTEITPELKREGLMREVIRHVQSARKVAGLNVDDRIRLSLSSTDDELMTAINEHEDAIMAETLATEMLEQDLAFSQTVNVDGVELVVSLEKA